jgi:mRNA deadenylase 3'-5' endonuclease subunit Ccr4
MEKLKTSQFGGFDAHPAPVMEQILACPGRNVRILAEIMRVRPTLLALEECDHYDDFFNPALSLLGYDSVFQPKHDSPCLEFGYYSDGVALFWRRDEFELRENLNAVGVVDENGSFVKVCHSMVVLDFLAKADADAAVVSVPHPQPPQPPLIFLTTHLKAKAVQKNEGIRNQQLRALAAKVKSVSVAQSTSRIVFCGDFNADPVTTSEVVATAVPGLFEAMPELRSSYPLDEAVTDVPGKGGHMWSTWKRRGDLEVKHFIDYILYDRRSFRATSILSAPKDEDLLDTRLPCLKYPSDHLSIAADLELLDVV